MKRSILAGVVLLGVMTTLDSCKEPEPEPISPLVGTWTRQEYQLSALPTGFTKYWEGETLTSFGETGYTFIFKADGTYSRSFTPLVDDKGTWTLDGTTLKVSPDDAKDLDDIEDIGFIGLKFEVEGEISDIRLVLSQVLRLRLASDAAIDAAGGPSKLNDVPDSDWKPVDVKILYKFNKLK